MPRHLSEFIRISIRTYQNVISILIHTINGKSSYIRIYARTYQNVISILIHTFIRTASEFLSLESMLERIRMLSVYLYIHLSERHQSSYIRIYARTYHMFVILISYIYQNGIRVLSEFIRIYARTYQNVISILIHTFIRTASEFLH